MDDAELLKRFESCTLPFEQWTHRAHVKVAHLLLNRHSFDKAVERMREGIKRFNAANGVPDGPTSGYHETTTVAFMVLIDATMRAYGRTFPAPTADQFCDTHPQLMTKHVLRLFYSPEQRVRPDAKHRFVPPDLAPLPAVRRQPGDSP